MHVLIIPTWYPNGADKLIGIYHKEYAQALAKNNVKVNMLYIDRQKISHPIKYLMMNKKEIIRENNYNTYIRKVFDVRRISYSMSINNYCKVLEKAFLDYIKINGKPDILHAEVTIPAGYATCKLGKKYNIPVVVSEHSSYYQRFFEGENKKYSDYVLNNSYYTTVSKYMADWINKKYNKCDVLPNLVDVDSFMLPRKKINGLRLITIAGLRRTKYIDNTIEALKIIIENKRIKDATLTVVGDGQDETFFKNRCHELGMDKYVNFVGRKKKEEVAKLLNEHNIYIVSSNIETFCIPAVEALASGIPVVSTKCFGPEGFIDEKCGKLVPFGDNKKMADAIIDVYNNYDKYDIKYLRSVANKFSAKSVTNEAIKIYNKLINEKK